MAVPKHHRGDTIEYRKILCSVTCDDLSKLHECKRRDIDASISDICLFDSARVTIAFPIGTEEVEAALSVG
jgi:hypothetical protein